MFFYAPLNGGLTEHSYLMYSSNIDFITEILLFSSRSINSPNKHQHLYCYARALQTFYTYINPSVKIASKSVARFAIKPYSIARLRVFFIKFDRVDNHLN